LDEYSIVFLFGVILDSMMKLEIIAFNLRKLIHLFGS